MTIKLILLEIIGYYWVSISDFINHPKLSEYSGRQINKVLQGLVKGNRIKKIMFNGIYKYKKNGKNNN